MDYYHLIKTETVLVPTVRHKLQNPMVVVTMSIAVFIFLLMSLSIMTAQTAHADGAIGSGGNSGGGSGGAQTYYGYGWYQFGVESAGPKYFKSGGPWSSVQQICRGLGTSSVIMYIIYTGYGGTPNTAAVYNYVGWPDTWVGNKGNNGLPWMTVATAHARYNSLTVDKSGYTFGSNVAWFCYSSIPKDYSLTPSATVNRDSGESGSPVDISSSVSNTGHTASVNTQWQLSRFVVPSGGSYSGAGNSNKPPAQYYGNGLTKMDSGTGVAYPVGGPTIVRQVTEDIPDYPAGSKICYALSVQPRSNTDSNWAHSEPDCVIVGKKPKIQIHGGDLIVGRPFDGLAGPSSPSVVNTNTSVKTIGGNKYTFGSWIEYGIFAVGTVTGTGSGSAFAGSGLVDATVCGYSTLTFVNATTSTPASSCSDTGSIGGYSTGLDIPNIAANFPITSATTVYNDSTANPQGVYRANDNNDPITINAKNIAKGQWVVVNAPNADVTISGDIKYTNSALQSIYDIPQTVIIAKNIYIAPNVKQVDAWLIAQGSQAANTGILDTCHISSDYTTPLTINLCNNYLQVNGPVMAQQLWLRRTGGSGVGSASGDPSEVFNLRPDAYLWAFAQSSVTGRIQSVYTQELPPRF